MKKESFLTSGRRGTTLWGFKRLNGDALTSLLNDLLIAEKTGLDKPVCDAVKASLGFIVNWTTEYPDGSFFNQPIWRVFKNFEDTYKSWNEPEGTGSAESKRRSNELQKLRKLRHKASKKIRKNPYILEKNLDFKLIDDTYEALGGIISAGPEAFKNLAKAIARFEKRKLG